MSAFTLYDCEGIAEVLRNNRENIDPKVFEKMSNEMYENIKADSRPDFRRDTWDAMIDGTW